MGRLPVDIWAISNIEVYGRHIEGNYVQYMCVLTCFFRPSEQEGSCCVRCGSPLSQFLIGIGLFYHVASRVVVVR